MASGHQPEIVTGTFFIEHEFRRISRKLQWPKQATMKDFRHLFNTSMQNAGMPEFYRRYLLGQSPGRSALVNYTHLNDLRQQYTRAVESVYRPLLDALNDRLRLPEVPTTEPEAGEESSPAPVGSSATATTSACQQAHQTI